MRRNLRVTARAAAVAAAAAALMGIGVGWVLGQTTFNDVPESDQRSEDIDYAAAQGWFQGYPDGSFRPDRPISEAQLARVIRRAHPGLTRGDAAVFLRGGIDRLRAADITPATTTAGGGAATTVAAATTTTTLPAGEPGGPGAGEPGTVDPNPPVVIETTTTTLPADTTTTTTTPPSDTTTTTTTTRGPGVPDGVGERNVVRYGFETGWANSNGQAGSLFWVEFAISGYQFPDDAILSNWWHANGSAGFTITGRDGDGRTVTRTLETTSNPTRFYPFEILRVSATCNHDCTPEGDTPMPSGARNWAGQFGYSKIAATTTTTTVATTATTAQPTGRTLVYGKANGWTNNRGVTGTLVWWEFRNWDSASKESTLTTDYGGSILIGAEDEPYPYWFSSSVRSDFRISAASCDEVSCTTMESSTMPDSIRNRLKADGFNEPSG